MTRMTKKFSEAVHRLNVMGVRRPHEMDAEAAYKKLADAGYLWDSKQGLWIKLADQPSDPASPMIRVRVWAPQGESAEVAGYISQAMRRAGFRVVEQSDPYPCRPPKQLEERTYVSYLKDA